LPPHFQKVVREFSVNIIGLSKKAHEFKYTLGKAFFDEFGKDLLDEGQFEATVVLDKRETFIEGSFTIKGTARLICDRSLEPFDHPIESKHKMVFKFGEEEIEVSDEIEVISPDKQSLNIGQYLYEFIGLSLPMKRIHPKYQIENDDNDEGGIIYSSSPENEKEEDTIDPRWEKLKKLK
jgi:uncharacterized metal-binding protein YceD (DUF177 family)